MCEAIRESDVAIRKETLILRHFREVALDVDAIAFIAPNAPVHRPSSTCITARESCAGMPRTLPEDSINGDSIEVVRQKDASEDHRGIEALVNARQECREDGDRSEAKELDEGRPFRHAEVRRQADRDASSKEAVAGDAYQTRGDDRAPSGSDCGETGRSGRRRTRRNRKGPRHHLTAVRTLATRRDGSSRPVSRSRYSRSPGMMRGTRQLIRVLDVRLQPVGYRGEYGLPAVVDRNDVPIAFSPEKATVG